MYLFISLALLSSKLVSGHSPSIIRKHKAHKEVAGGSSTKEVAAHSKTLARKDRAHKDVAAHSEDAVDLLQHTSEFERKTYLESHSDQVAVFPGLISRGDALKLHEAVDRRWRHVRLSHVKRLAAEDGDGDNLVDSVDMKASYSADIISDGSCTAGDDDDDEEFMLKKDCALVERLLQKHVTPLVEQKVKEWKVQGGQDFNGTLFACDSFVKRYMPGERHELHAHRDMTSLMTTNVLLSHPDEFQGGLVMYPEADELESETESEQSGYLEADDMGRGVFLEHGQGVGIGGLVLHRGSMWHGVQMLQTEKSRRYSWITWYAPTKKHCEQYTWDD